MGLGSGETKVGDSRRCNAGNSGDIGGRRGSFGAVAGGERGETARSLPRRAFAGMPGAINPDGISGAGAGLREGGLGTGGDRGSSGAWAATDPESFLRENLSLTDLVSLAYMFNFTSDAGVLSLGERKAVVQVSVEC